MGDRKAPTPPPPNAIRPAPPPPPPPKRFDCGDELTADERRAIVWLLESEQHRNRHFHLDDSRFPLLASAARKLRR
jgi:hypothetical protein